MDIEIKTKWIQLDQLLKLSGVIDTGGMAKHMIKNGEVYRNGEVELRRSKKIYPGDIIEFNGETIQVK